MAAPATMPHLAGGVGGRGGAGRAATRPPLCFAPGARLATTPTLPPCAALRTCRTIHITRIRHIFRGKALSRAACAAPPAFPTTLPALLRRQTALHYTTQHPTSAFRPHLVLRQCILRPGRQMPGGQATLLLAGETAACRLGGQQTTGRIYANMLYQT